MSIENLYLKSVIKHLTYYKELGDQTFVLLSDTHFHFTPNKDNNSIAIIIQHIAGNMLSRWTNFLSTDGEKNWPNRDNEFIEQYFTKAELITLWEKGWKCFLDAVYLLQPKDLLTTIYIRKEALTVIDAINRQMAHYPYHIGQIIYLGKIILDKNWQSLSIAKGASNKFNEEMKQ